MQEDLQEAHQEVELEQQGGVPEPTMVKINNLLSSKAASRKLAMVSRSNSRCLRWAASS